MSLAGPAVPGASAADQAEGPGRKIYQQQCASCHGPSGRGVEDEYAQPLTGSESVGDLAQYIEKWMPEGEPEKVAGDEAREVARYIHDAFYSPLAQARNEEARIALARLTVPQYRNAVADLIGGFRSPERFQRGEKRGLSARYFNKENPRGKPDLKRRDAQVGFHFAESDPIPEELEAKQGFSAQWEGSLIAPATGEYEIIIHTDHAARLWLNEMDEPLLDEWVKSGDQTEYKAKVFLVGGRAYPLKLWYNSRQQGVDGKKKRDGKPIKGFIKLHWKRPHHAAEPISEPHLLPKQAPERFVVDTSFPPDDSSEGYERGTSISAAWDGATTDAAIETANYVVDHLKELSGVGEKADDRGAKLRTFTRRFLERAFRRPLDDYQEYVYLKRRFASAPDPETAVKRAVLLAMKSPRFLYLGIGDEEPGAYHVASRLSFALWNSVPDEQLRKAAASGELRTREQVLQQARRMLDDPRAWLKVRRFLHGWLRLGHGGELAKDDEKFPGFNERIASDLRTSLDLLLKEAAWGEGSDFRDLVLADELHLNGRLAEFYGYDALPADAGFQKVEAKRPQRKGVFSHPYLMANFAYTDVSSPIHRGVFLIRNVLGQTLQPPPDNFSPESPDLHPDLTTRERVAKQTSPESCMKCHSKINPVGFTLEHFDAVGRFRKKDRGKPIDASGSFMLPNGEEKGFKDSRDLAAFVADSEQAHRAFVVQLFHHLMKQPILAYGPRTPEALTGAFAAGGYSVRELVAAIATRGALEGVTDAPPPKQASAGAESE